jgi:hypothetical protein
MAATFDNKIEPHKKVGTVLTFGPAHGDGILRIFSITELDDWFIFSLARTEEKSIPPVKR